MSITRCSNTRYYQVLTDTGSFAAKLIESRVFTNVQQTHNQIPAVRSVQQQQEDILPKRILFVFGQTLPNTSPRKQNIPSVADVFLGFLVWHLRALSHLGTNFLFSMGWVSLSDSKCRHDAILCLCEIKTSRASKFWAANNKICPGRAGWSLNWCRVINK